ncbi:glycosyltransferase family 1 protein [Corynebacterium sp. P7202]|uniref:Glycosyltransferase family 1 protein n=1 Tax=Corynebacterium pygosceleis TaxID=2800406 RepID=A0A9Q4C7W3_9CORY|nr:glycosyltransferase family 1 protein [Corynebacterium pygosceleis]MCK7637466.1 glycosyltransferase family 1 protein [Corynebacterium pygosceleis]MCX7468205.1 glycosyltransferase family 1 protein [Corynebacterium pygosceleis]
MVERRLRIAVVAESFLPNVNGVTNSVLRVLEHLSAHGHEAIVIAPGARDFEEEVVSYAGFPVVRVPTVMVPLINSLPVGVPVPMMYRTLRNFRPDVIHLASPYVLGTAGASAARRLRVPAVAVYQTDVAGFALRYHLRLLISASWRVTRMIHNSCARTLAPSTAAIAELTDHGVRNVHRWARGVDTERFNPAHRSTGLRRSWDPTGERRIVGYVGRLAAEKGVDRLACLSGRDDLQLVIVGDGPELGALRDALPGAVFTGALHGAELARVMASFDVFVHPGEFETFCQTIQEAQASGVPTIGPRAGGPVDLITPGENGDLLEVDTFSEDLPAAVDRVLAERGEMSAAALDRVAGRTWEGVCAELVDHYRQVLRHR